MSDFPKGGDIEATSAWLEGKGFPALFIDWEADAILGKSDEYIKSKFPGTLKGQDQADRLCGLLATARQAPPPVLGATVAGGSAGLHCNRTWWEFLFGHNEQVVTARQEVHGNQVWFLCETTVVSIHKFGLRGSVYDLAAIKFAFHSNKEMTSIRYENPNMLVVRVLFEQKGQCGHFQNSLECMVKRHFDQNAVVEHPLFYNQVTYTWRPSPILGSHYIRSDNPDTDDYSVFSGCSSPRDDTVVDDEMQPILWENANLPCFTGGCKGHKCHLMSQISYIQHADDSNNVMIMSYDNHNRFDDKIPHIAIRWCGQTDKTVTVKGEDLTYCDIAIECINEEVYENVGKYIKLGTVSEPSKNAYFTNVAVPNPDLFRQFLTFKYLETKKLQAVDKFGSIVERLSRAREEVKQTMEQDASVTIDMTIQRRNKRKIAVVDT